MYLGTCTAIPTAPSPPRMLTMIGEPTGSTVELNWLPPLHPNGAIHYEIEYEPAMTPGDPVNAGSSSSPYFTLTLPNEFLTYSVTVAAVNTQGQARSGDLTVLCPGRDRESGRTTEYTNYKYVSGRAVFFTNVVSDSSCLSEPCKLLLSVACMYALMFSRS